MPWAVDPAENIEIDRASSQRESDIKRIIVSVGKESVFRHVIKTDIIPEHSRTAIDKNLKPHKVKIIVQIRICNCS